ncbi:DUF871 family protein [Schleiferilactobacillus harbinensis]|uniref:MupG family TIM beta-alpha barrel fold protein n=1 Tax=Schleiferilactobacillus harbinensis TaxID=304207 RepID=UPI0021A5B890|nr:MupG family TIM beta-alpha barrel fold protein [Schleiferilactobacillus harbinensis]MCT2909041.1 DUF871 family protein [Schleiferilactobacillus harbinensis]
MLGISAYPKDIDPDYLKQAAAAGVREVFTSLQIPEDTPTEFTQGLRTLQQAVHALDLNVIVDISPATFKKLGLADNDFNGIYAQGFHSLRLDYGFDDPALIRKLQKHFTVVLNASTVQVDFLNALQVEGVDLRKLVVAHNFYPKPDTGLTAAYFAEKNKLFQEWEIPLLAFIPGDGLKRYPVYAGVPTLEHQRGFNSYAAYLEMALRYGVEWIYVGDSQLTAQSLAWIQRFSQDGVITLPVAGTTQLPSDPLKVRREVSPGMVRIQTPRQATPVGPVLDRPAGTVTIENDLAGRYHGEIDIAKTGLPFSPTSNYLGTIPAPFLPVLPLLDGQHPVQFTAL